MGKVTLSVSDEFECIDESDLDAGAKTYFAGDFLVEEAGIEYNFSSNNTNIVFRFV